MAGCGRQGLVVVVGRILVLESESESVKDVKE